VPRTLQSLSGSSNYWQALQYLEKYTSLKDSLDTEKSQKEVYELNLKYEVKEKDNAILQQQLELKNSRFLLFLVLGSLVILAFLAFSYSWRHKLQKEVITMLFHKERELEKEIHRLRNLYPTSPPSAPLTPEEQEQDFILQLFLKAGETMESKNLYLNPEFSLHEFVQLLNTNRSYLSQAINEYADGGFRAFLNRYRVEHAKTLVWAIASGDTQIPLGDIWQHADANSNKSFYRFFKNVTGITPKEYLDELKLEMNNPNPLSETPE
jgi:YesN/AraC family two-component response regulator